MRKSGDNYGGGGGRDGGSALNKEWKKTRKQTSMVAAILGKLRMFWKIKESKIEILIH